MKLGISALSMTITVCLLVVTSQSSAQQDETEATSDFFHQIRTERIQSDPLVEWKNFGPGMSGYNEEFWTHPTDTDVMFIGPDMHVSYGSWDDGKSWHTLKDPDGLGLEMKRVLDIEFSVQDANFGMAIDWNGWAYETTDRGRSWKKIKKLGRNHDAIGIEPNDAKSFEKGWYYEQQGTRHSELAVDPTDDNIWYVGAGDFWNVKANHKSFAKPHGNRFLYADYGHIWKTTDKGKTWKKLTNDLPEDVDIGKIIVNPNNNRNVIVATSHGLLTSDDGGLSWKSTSDGLPNDLPRDLTSYYDKATGEFALYLLEQSVYEDKGNLISTKGGIFKSVDGGASWTDITGNLGIDLNAINNPDTIERYHRTLAHWFGISAAESKSRFTRLPKATLPVFNRIAVNPLDRDEIYISYNKKHDRTFGHGDVWRTLNGGRTWIAVARHGDYWKSRTDTEYWKDRGNPVGTNIEFAHLQRYMDSAPEHSGNRMLAVNAVGDVFIGIDQQTLRSIDQGRSWQQIDDFETSPGSNKWIGRGGSNLPGRFMLHETGIPGRRLLSSGEHGLWQTTDLDGWHDKTAVAVEQIEGQNHEDGIHSVSTVAVNPDDPDTIYILSWRQQHHGKVRRTIDGGKTWENIATIFEGQDKSFQKNTAPQNSLLIDPVDPDNMYFCATALKISEIHNGPSPRLGKGGYGFHRSSDAGYTWELSNDGIHEGASVRRLAMHPDDPSVLYAAANDENGGLYRTNDRGDNWTKVVIPPLIKAVNNVFIDRNNKYIYISTGRNDGSYEEGGVWRSTDHGATWQMIFKAPFVWQTESSPVNPDLIVISVAGQIVSMPDPFMNPGIYLSLDAGDTWRKINRNLGQPDKVVDVKPDPYNENVLWSALWGSGWYVGYLKGVKGWSER